MTFREKVEAAKLEEITFALMPVALILAIFIGGMALIVSGGPRPRQVVIETRGCK